MGKLLHEVRGFRNNNPGNLEKSSAFTWDGQVDTLPGIPEEKRFCQFSNLDYGIRALYRLLKTYREKYNLKSLKEIISRWAPPQENDTTAYVASVIKTMKMYYPNLYLDPNTPIDKKITREYAVA